MRSLLVQVSRAENVFEISIWCVCGASHASHALSYLILSYQKQHCALRKLFTPRLANSTELSWSAVPGTSLVHRLSMENLAQNVDDFFSEGYVSGGAHGLVLNAEQQVRWPDCATPSGALDPPRSQLTSSLHLFPHHLAASPHPPQAIADAPGPHGKPASALRASSLPALVAPCAPPLPLPLARCAPPR